MLEAIASAKHSIAFQTYIFDNDPVGHRFADAFADAAGRGVEVRVLIDAVGARYSRPAITRRLARRNVRTDLFMGRLLPMRLPYVNLRTHRKILIVDGTLGFCGGMNVRDEFADGDHGAATATDTHFSFKGPVVSQLFRVFAGDWWFTTGERLRGRQWAQRRAANAGHVLCRPIDSGPDDGLERAHDLILGAIAVAQKSIRICSPYFLPDRALVAGLTVAARRGIEVDIVIPAANNLRFVGWAITAQLDQVIRPGCRVWRAQGRFDHSKLMVVDGAWRWSARRTSIRDQCGSISRSTSRSWTATLRRASRTNPAPHRLGAARDPGDAGGAFLSGQAAQPAPVAVVALSLTEPFHK